VTFCFVKSKLNGNVIDIQGASISAGASLDAYPEKPSTNNQLWEFAPDPAGSGYLFIKSQLNGNVIDIYGASTSAGALLDAYPQKPTGTDNQLWELFPDPAGSGYYFIKSKLNGNVIDIYGASTSAGALLDAYPQKPSTNNQLWQFVPDPAGSGYYFIQSQLNGNVIDIQGASTSAGALLDAYPQKPTGTNNQLWQFVPDPAGSGYYFIQSQLNGNVIDIYGASTSAGALLDAYPLKTTGTDNQLWQAVGGIFPVVRALTFNEQYQQESEWCWAATTVSITLYYDPASTWTQCSLVNQAFGLTTCCQDGSSTACNQPWYPDQALTITGHLASTSGGKPSFDVIVSQIDADHPVPIAIYWNGGGGHNPAVSGYDGSTSAAPVIDIQDPIYGPSTQDFNSFPGSYNGGATWGESYFTK